MHDWPIGSRPLLKSGILSSLLALGLSAQTVSITNLGSIITSWPFYPTFSITNGSGNAIDHVCVLVNYQRFQPRDCAPASNLSIPLLVGIPGDGDATFQAIAYDAFGNILASDSVRTQSIRLSGLHNTATSIPTSGSGSPSLVVWNGLNMGGNCNFGVYVDGKDIPSGGTDDTWTAGACGGSGQMNGTLKTYRNLPNGMHQIRFKLTTPNLCPGTDFDCDPYLLSNTFVAANVQTSTPWNVTLTSPNPHWLVTNRPVAATTTGTLPTDGGTGNPILAGQVFAWGTSPTNASNTILSGSATSGVISITLSSTPSPALVPSTSTVDIHRFVTSAAGSLTGICDGNYTVASASGATFTVNAPTCPNGTWAAGTSGTAVVTNPIYAIFVDGNTVGWSHTPNGPAIQWSSGGSGTHTVLYVMRPGYWQSGAYDTWDTNTAPNGFAFAAFTTANGSHSMEMRPPYSYVHLCLTPTATCPSSISIAPKIANTDGTFTTIAANSVTYPYLDDGGFTGVASVNSTTGLLTAASPGWGVVTETCTTCDSGNSLPPVVVRVQVENNATFPHFSRSNGIISTYTTGQSFLPISIWGIDPLYATTFVTDATQRNVTLGQLANDSGITAMETGDMQQAAYLPTSNSCGSGALSSTDSLIISWAQANGNIALTWDLENATYPPWQTGYIANSIPFNRLACLTTYIGNLAASGQVHSLQGPDEVSAKAWNAFPNPNGAIGSTNFTNITFTGGVATYNVLMNIEAVFNQSTGTGAIVYLSGATTNSCINGWQKVTGITNNGAGNTTSFTTATTCAGSGTINAASDPSLTMQYQFNHSGFAQNGTSAGPLPKNHTYSYQGWNNQYDNNGNPNADTSLTSMTSNGTLLTVNYTAHAITNGQFVRIYSASTNSAANGEYVVQGAATNSFQIPTTITNGTTINAASDPNLVLSVDSNMPNNYLVSLRNAVQAGGSIPIVQPILGSTYNNTVGVKNWNAANISDHDTLYHSDPLTGCGNVYGDDCSVWSEVFDLGSNYQSAVVARAFETGARKDLLELTPALYYQKFHQGYNFAPLLDRPININWRPETIVARMEANIGFGISGAKVFGPYQGNNTGQYAIGQGLFGGSNAIAETYPYDRTWGSLARAARLSQTEAKYILQPRLSAPYLGPYILTSIAGTATLGYVLKMTCVAEVPINISGTTLAASAYAQTIDLTPIRFSGGSMYMNTLTPYTSSYSAVAGNPTSLAVDPCATAGQTISIYSQPTGVQSDLQTYVFPQPTSFPAGATQAAVVPSYYPRYTSDDKPVPCTSTGCPVPAVTPFWWSYQYMDASGNVVGRGTPIERMQ